MGQFVGASTDTCMNMGCEGSAWCNKRLFFFFFWKAQQRQHQQGPADHPERDLRWSQPWKGQPQPCLHHFNSFSASLLPTWGLARCSPPPGVSLLPPSLFLPLPPVMDLFPKRKGRRVYSWAFTNASDSGAAGREDPTRGAGALPAAPRATPSFPGPPPPLPRPQTVLKQQLSACPPNPSQVTSRQPTPLAKFSHSSALP